MTYLVGATIAIVFVLMWGAGARGHLGSGVGSLGSSSGSAWSKRVRGYSARRAMVVCSPSTRARILEFVIPHLLLG
jgi:hypothetical protein